MAKDDITYESKTKITSEVESGIKKNPEGNKVEWTAGSPKGDSQVNIGNGYGSETVNNGVNTGANNDLNEKMASGYEAPKSFVTNGDSQNGLQSKSSRPSDVSHDLPQSKPSSPSGGASSGRRLDNNSSFGSNGYGNGSRNKNGINDGGNRGVPREVPEEARNQGVSNEKPSNGSNNLAKNDGLDGKNDGKQNGKNNLNGGQNNLANNPDDNQGKKDEEKGNSEEKENPEDVKSPENKSNLAGQNNLDEGKKSEDVKNPEAKGGNPDDKPKESNNLNKNEGLNVPGSNGYGATKNGTVGSNDSTANARKTLENNQRLANNGANVNLPRNNSTLPISSGLGLRQRLRNGARNFLNRGKGLFGGKSSSDISDGNGGNADETQEESSQISKKIIDILKKNPTLVMVLGIFLLILLSLFLGEVATNNNSSKKGATKCVYNLNGVTSTGSISLADIQVEIVNCDATKDNYTVLATVDFEKYVVGVALAEYGARFDEGLKAQIIAVRGFSLTRNKGMCPSNPDDCFYGYNASMGKIRLRACEADQVYWDYTQDIYRIGNGSISYYTPEVTGTEANSKLWHSALSADDQARVEALADEVKGVVLLDSDGNVAQTNYTSVESTAFADKSAAGEDYEQILSEVYNYNSYSSASCSSGTIDYGDYVLSSDGSTILHQPLDTFLASQGTSLEEFNNLIAYNVEKSGYGTRAGVVAAAVTLIAELGNNYNVKIPYFWSGGHGDGIAQGAKASWGSGTCYIYANSQAYNYCGLDCSGFVAWAISNGGFTISSLTAGSFQNLDGAERVSLTSSAVLEPGDLLESSHHVILVVGVDEVNKQYICAEASGNASGVLFTRRSFTFSGYWGVKMSGYYSTHAKGA